MFCRLEDHPLVNESVQHLPVNASLIYQVGKDAFHITVGLREREGLSLLLGTVWQGFPVVLEQEFHSVDKGFAHELSDKVDSIAASLFVLVVPKISADSDLLALAQPFVFRAGGLQLLPLGTEQLHQIGPPCDFCLLR